MIKCVAFIFTFYCCSICDSQQIVTSISSSCYFDNFPNDIFGSVHVGASWKHFSHSLVFTNMMGYRETSFQLLGLKSRGYFRPVGKIINAFFELEGSTQISGKRTGTPMISGTFQPTLEYNDEYKGDRFLKANFQGDFSFGVSGSFKRVELWGSIGRSVRYWSSYRENGGTKIGDTKGLVFAVGLSYFFDDL